MEYWIMGLGCCLILIGLMVIAQLGAIVIAVRQTQLTTEKILGGLDQNVSGLNSFHVIEGH